MSNKIADSGLGLIAFAKNKANDTEITNIKNGTTHLFENITDSHGNKRFVEGDITMNEIEGLTQTYGKWSLSGTHLMIVLSGIIAGGTTLGADTIASVIIPSYIGSKINAVVSSIIDVKDAKAYNSSYNELILSLQLRKYSNTNLYIRNGISRSTTENRTFRIQFDLLIDAS